MLVDMTADGCGGGQDNASGQGGGEVLITGSGILKLEAQKGPSSLSYDKPYF